MPAVFEEEKLGSVFLVEIKADGAIAAGQIALDTATGAHAVDLVDPDVSANVKLSPRFDENGAARLFLKQRFQRWTFVFGECDRRRGLEGVIVEAGRLDQTGSRQLLPG